MTFWLDIAAFALKALILTFAVAGVVVVVARAARSRGGGEPDEIEI